MTNPTRKRVVTLDDLNVLNQNAAYARQKGEEASAAAQQADTARQNLEVLGGDTQAAGQQATQAAQAATLAKNSATAAALQASQAAGDAVTAAELAEGAAGTANQAAGAATMAAQRVTDAVLDLTDIKVDIAQAAAAADAAVNTLSKSSGRGIIRPTKAAGDTDFPVAAVGDTLTVVETEDVYLKLAGATDWGQPITNLGTGSVSIRRFAPGSTVASQTAALEAALAFSAGAGRPEVVIDRPLTINTVNVPGGAQFRCIRSGSITPNGNITALRFGNTVNDHTVRADINVVLNSVAYTATAVEVSGRATWRDGRLLSLRGSITNVAIDSGTPPHAASVGLALRSDTGFVSLAQIPELTISGFGTTLLLHANGGQPGGYTTGFVNGNQFGELGCYYFRRGIVFQADADAGEVASNTISSHQLQTRTYSTNGVLGVGRYAHMNTLMGKCWDLPLEDAVYRFDPASQGNYMRDSGMDLRLANIGPYNVLDTNYRARMPHTRIITPPRGIHNRAFSGTQDDFLTAAASRFAVAQTAGPASNAGTLSSVFVDPPSSRLRWALTAGQSVQITVTFGRTIGNIDVLGAQFLYGNIPGSCQVEYLSGGNWITPVGGSTATNALHDWIWQFEGLTGTVTADAVRWTFSGAAAGTLELARLWGRSGDEIGRTWLPSTGGTLTGALTGTTGTFSGAVTAGAVDVAPVSNGSNGVSTVRAKAADGTVRSFVTTVSQGGNTTYTVPGSAIWQVTQFQRFEVQDYLGARLFRAGDSIEFAARATVQDWGSQALANAGSQVLLRSRYQAITAAATYTMTATPAIAGTTDGSIITLVNTGTFSITFQSESTLTGTKLKLGAAARTLSTGDSLTLIYSAALGLWVEIGFTDTL